MPRVLFDDVTGFCALKRTERVKDTHPRKMFCTGRVEEDKLSPPSIDSVLSFHYINIWRMGIFFVCFVSEKAFCKYSISQGGTGGAFVEIKCYSASAACRVPVSFIAYLYFSFQVSRQIERSEKVDLSIRGSGLF